MKKAFGFILWGGIFSVFIFDLNYDYYRLTSHGLEVPAHIIEKRNELSSRRWIKNCDVKYSFTTKTDIQLSGDSGLGDQRLCDTIHQRRNVVIYDPSNPERNSLAESIGNLRYIVVMMDMILAFFLAVPIYSIIKRRK